MVGGHVFCDGSLLGRIVLLGRAVRALPLKSSGLLEIRHDLRLCSATCATERMGYEENQR